MSDEFSGSSGGSDGGNPAVADSGSSDGNNTGGGNDSSFQGMQERMADDSDSPWYSSSEGKMVTPDGDVVLNPKTNQPFKSQQEYDLWVAQNPPVQQEAAKPKTPEAQKPMSKSFGGFFGDEITPEKLTEIAQRGNDYQYKDDFVPAIDEKQAQETESTEDVDPVKAVQESRASWNAIAVEPINEIYQALIDQGADPSAARQLIQPILDKQQKLVDGHYQEQYQKALEDKLTRPINAQRTELEQKELIAKSNGNINALASKYFPEGGNDAFFSLVSGYNDENGNWVRGDAAPVVDMLVNAANGGKKFSNAEKRSEAYANTFRQIVSDPAKAAALFDIVKSYWVGKNFGKAKQAAFDTGKQAVQQSQIVKNRTFKPKPNSHSETSDEYEGMPNILRKSMMRMNG